MSASEERSIGDATQAGSLITPWCPFTVTARPAVKVAEDVALGLVSTKSDALETPEALLVRIEEAARYFPREQMALSTQCGFASVLAGNPIAEATQEKKLRLVAEVARRAWS